MLGVGFLGFGFAILGFGFRRPGFLGLDSDGCWVFGNGFWYLGYCCGCWTLLDVGCLKMGFGTWRRVVGVVGVVGSGLRWMLRVVFDAGKWVFGMLERCLGLDGFGVLGAYCEYPVT